MTNYELARRLASAREEIAAARTLALSFYQNVCMFRLHRDECALLEREHPWLMRVTPPPDAPSAPEDTITYGGVTLGLTEPELNNPEITDCYRPIRSLAERVGDLEACSLFTDWGETVEERLAALEERLRLLDRRVQVLEECWGAS